MRTTRRRLASLLGTVLLGILSSASSTFAIDQQGAASSASRAPSPSSAPAAGRPPQAPAPAARPIATPMPSTLADLLAGLRDTAKTLEPASGMKLAFAALLKKNGLGEAGVSYADFVLVRLLFESTRDAGLWNLQWTITDREPRSDAIWQQWQRVAAPSPPLPTATAECDELSALFAFLTRSLGVHGVGLFWPQWNHTVAVWEIRTTKRPPVRVVVPTTQIFLAETDYFGTDSFDPWRQQTIHEYVRRDAAATQRLPPALLAFFLAQSKRYAGATDGTLQRLRYLREAVFQRRLTPAQAAVLARRDRADALALRAPREDLAAFDAFAAAMAPPQRSR